MAGDPAELAYGHALAMLGDPNAASEVAITALRRAGRARRLVLAHARHQAVARAALDEPVDIENLQTVVLDLPALAATLASTRPPEERAALDLRARTGGDLAALGEAIGMGSTAAANKCAEIAAVWETQLDPALLAFVGAGDCEGLSAILDQTPRVTVADLLAIAPAVGTHAQTDVACADRMRAMNSVRSFFSAGTAEMPPEVREASRVSRRMRPAAPPPPLFAASAGVRRGLLRYAAVAAVVAALIAAGVGLAVRRHHDDDVAKLTLIKKSTLALGTPQFTKVAAKVTVHNGGTTDTRYSVTASTDWVRITPRRSSIVPRETQTLTITPLKAAPEGDDRVAITVTAESGASVTQDITFSVEHPPDIAASAVGCAVSVNVVEEGTLTSVVLHWIDTTEHQIDITSGPDGYNATLQPEGQPITYWVTATDARGNQARTANQTIPADAC